MHLTLFGSTASYTTISKCIDCDETIPGIPLRNFELSSISSILWKKNITIMLVLQRYFGPENYSRALDYLANHMWLFKNWTLDIDWKHNNIQNNFKQLWSDFRKVFKWTCHLMKWITIDHEMWSLKWTGIQTIHKWLISRSGPFSSVY